MSASEESNALRGTVPFPESAFDKLETQIVAIKSQLTAAEGKFVTVLDAVENKLTAAESKLDGKESELIRIKEELRSLKAQKLAPIQLAGSVVLLAIAMGSGFVYLSVHILHNSISWQQTCGVLGLCLFWVAFAAISVRALADRSR